MNKSQELWKTANDAWKEYDYRSGIKELAELAEEKAYHQWKAAKEKAEAAEKEEEKEK